MNLSSDDISDVRSTESDKKGTDLTDLSEAASTVPDVSQNTDQLTKANVESMLSHTPIHGNFTIDSFNIDCLLLAQIAIAQKFQIAYYAFKAHPKTCRQIKNLAYECREFHTLCAGVMAKFAQTCEAVLRVLSDLALAIEENLLDLGSNIFENVWSWIREMRFEAEHVQTFYSRLLRELHNLVERAVVLKSSFDWSNMLCIGEKNEAFVDIDDKKELMQYFRRLYRHQLALKDTPKDTRSDDTSKSSDELMQSANAVTENKNDYEMIEKEGFSPFDIVSPEIVKDGTSIESTSERVAQGSACLVTALHELKKIDPVMRNCSNFWASMDQKIDRLAKMKEHTEQLVKYTNNPRLRERFALRLSEFAAFWQHLGEICAKYVAEVNKTARMYDFSVFLEQKRC
eukprot:GHVL01001255.1.p1 GENE.GHVL01001255.1~~GHVL01001255.1.p1  ORF type:complete len:400 (+),score=72.20 GHVL01001255.1:1076-2275(+)